MIRTSTSRADHFGLARARCQRVSPSPALNAVLDLAALLVLGVPPYMVEHLAERFPGGLIVAAKRLAKQVLEAEATRED